MQFSVIIPARNAAAFLTGAIMSVFSQTGVTFEVIVVDDGSTDMTASIIKKLQADDNRLVTLANPVSVGVSAARNQALAVAQGEWIALLDADDEFLPDRLGRMVEEAERRSLDMFADNLALRSELGESLGIAFTDPELQQAPMSLETFLLHDMPKKHFMGVGYWKPIIRRKFLTTHHLVYQESISAAEDFLFYSECLLAGARLAFSSTPGYLYTVRTDGHGTAFNLQTSKVNQLILAGARKVRPSAIPILELRQREIDYDAFKKSWRAKRFAEALTFFRLLPSSFVIRCTAIAISTRARKSLGGR